MPLLFLSGLPHLPTVGNYKGLLLLCLLWLQSCITVAQRPAPSSPLTQPPGPSVQPESFDKGIQMCSHHQNPDLIVPSPPKIPLWSTHFTTLSPWQPLVLSLYSFPFPEGYINGIKRYVII